MKVLHHLRTLLDRHTLTWIVQAIIGERKGKGQYGHHRRKEKKGTVWPLQEKGKERKGTVQAIIAEKKCGTNRQGNDSEKEAFGDFIEKEKQRSQSISKVEKELWSYHTVKSDDRLILQYSYCSAVQCSIYSTVQYSTVQYSASERTVQYCKVQCSICSTLHLSVHITVQYSTSA